MRVAVVRRSTRILGMPGRAAGIAGAASAGRFETFYGNNKEVVWLAGAIAATAAILWRLFVPTLSRGIGSIQCYAGMGRASAANASHFRNWHEALVFRCVRYVVAIEGERRTWCD